MLVTVDTEYIDLVHNTEVLEAALGETPYDVADSLVASIE